MSEKSLPHLLLRIRRLQQWSVFLLFANMVFWAALYGQVIVPVFMPDDMLNPAFQRFSQVPAVEDAVARAFATLNAYNDYPLRNPRPDADLLLSDEPQFGILVRVAYRVAPQAAPSPDGVLRFRYDTHIEVRPALRVLVLFVASELVSGALLAWGLFGRKERLQAEFEDKVLRGYYFPEESEVAVTPLFRDALQRVLSRFHVFANEMSAPPRASHVAWHITDEYDVQHALCGLLRAHFDNVKPEETTPSLAGSSSRIDFLLVNERLGIETKMMRSSLSEKQLGEALLLDLAHFPSHSQCDSLVFFVYDPAYMIRNPACLRDDVAGAARGYPVEVVFSPPR
jgi:hypothetical protein